MNLNLALNKGDVITSAFCLLLLTAGTCGQARYGLVVPGDLTLVSMRATHRVVDVLLKTPKESLARFQECKETLTDVLDDIREDDTVIALKGENRTKSLLDLVKSIEAIIVLITKDVKQIHRISSLIADPAADADEECDLHLSTPLEGALLLETALNLSLIHI